MATMREIARKARVTPMTVSRAFRSDQSIHPETRQRILRVAAAYGYVYDARVSSLMSNVRKRTLNKFQETIAWIWPSAIRGESRNEHIDRFLSGTRTRAAQLGYGIDEFCLDTPGLSRTRLRQILVSRGIRGAIFAPIINVSRARLNFSLSGLACAAIGEALWRPRLHHTRFDHYLGMRQVLHRLKNLGYRRIAFAIDDLTNRRAHRAFESCFFVHHPMGSAAARSLCFTDAQFPAKFDDWLIRTKPDAVVGAGDYMRRDIERNGFRIPADLGFVSLNIASPTSTCSGINQNEELIASNAVELVIEQLQQGVSGPPENVKVVVSEGVWHNGETTPRRSRSSLAGC